MKTQIVLLKIAGIISLAFMSFHFLFYSKLGWEEGLSCLTRDNRSIMLTYHYASILITGFMGLIPLFQAKELVISKLKYGILSMFALFYLTRIVTEFTLFGFSGTVSVIIITMCLIPLIFYSLPLLSHNKQIQYENSKSV